MFNDLFKARKDRIAFKILLVFGSLVLLGALVGGNKPSESKWTVEECMRETFALAKRSGLHSSHYQVFLAGLKDTCQEMTAKHPL